MARPVRTQTGLLAACGTGFLLLGRATRSLVVVAFFTVTEVELVPTGAAGLTRSDRPILLKPCLGQSARGQLPRLLPACRLSLFQMSRAIPHAPSGSRCQIVMYLPKSGITLPLGL